MGNNNNPIRNRRKKITQGSERQRRNLKGQMGLDKVQTKRGTVSGVSPAETEGERTVKDARVKKVERGKRVVVSACVCAGYNNAQGRKRLIETEG